VHGCLLGLSVRPWSAGRQQSFQPCTSCVRWPPLLHGSGTHTPSCTLPLCSPDSPPRSAREVVSELDTLAGGCVLCHEVDFQRGGFGPRTIMLCDQCEREFHVGCLSKCGVADLDAVPEGEPRGQGSRVLCAPRDWLACGSGPWGYGWGGKGSDACSLSGGVVQNLFLQ
jgi:hypothetical protein